MSGTPNSARQQANTDFNSGKLPANTQNWNAPLREAYDTEYSRRQKDQQSK